MDEETKRRIKILRERLSQIEKPSESFMDVTTPVKEIIESILRFIEDEN